MKAFRNLLSYVVLALLLVTIFLSGCAAPSYPPTVTPTSASIAPTPSQPTATQPPAAILYHNPFKATQVHCHRLTPARLRQLVSGLPLEHLGSEFHLLRSPQFFSPFRRL